MGILNVTPDSFSDGGLHFDAPSAIKSAIQMAEDGADIIDIGGESTRPGSEAVSIEEELRRTIPVIQSLAKEGKIPISIDTCKAEVAKKALDAGASMVNDISGLRFDPGMSKVVAEYKVPVVIVHMKGAPRDMQKNPVYEPVLQEIFECLREGFRVGRGRRFRKTIIVDPVSVRQNSEHNLRSFTGCHEFSFLEKRC